MNQSKCMTVLGPYILSQWQCKGTDMKNIDSKLVALQKAQSACLSINQHLGREEFGPEVLSMLSELKVDLMEIRADQELQMETFGPLS